MFRQPAQLLQAFRKNDRRAAEELAGRAYRVALRSASMMISDKGQAEDVAQETALEVLRWAAGIRDPAALDAWIRRVAVRRSVRAVRRFQKRGDREIPLEALPASQEIATDAPPGVQVERRELAEHLRKALETLPPKQRMALILKYVHDLSQQDIADALDVRLGSAGALLSRGREALRKQGVIDETLMPNGVVE